MASESFLWRVRRRFIHEFNDWIRSSLPLLAFIIAFRVTVVDAFHVPTGSMRPTILEGERFFGARCAYWFSEPSRGDIVVFRPPAAAKEWIGPRVPRLLKRVVAIEGDVVEVRDGQLRINGLAVDEPYIAERPDYRLLPARVPPGHVFVLGDNRNNSADGHFWGFLPEDHIKARLFARYWPPNRIGRV